MEACLALGCGPAQAAGVAALAMKESDWGATYRAFNLGGWTVTLPFVEARLRESPGASTPWWRGPDVRPGAERSWAWYRAFRSVGEYLGEWVACFVPRPHEASPYPAFGGVGERFWGGLDWFPALLASGYRGPVGEADPPRAIREHDALVVTALRMWAQSKLAVAADGHWGAATGAALSAWQAAHSLPVTNALDDKTLNGLTGLPLAARGEEEDVVPLDEGWPGWALQAVDVAQCEPDALDALILALERRPAAARRAGALRLWALLGFDAPT